MTQQHHLLPREMNFKEESLAESMARYSGFGKDLFLELESHFPGMLSKFRFFQPQDSQEDDIWSYYQDDTVQFAVQLEPNTPVIVLWDAKPENNIEIGDWSEDPIADVIRFIEEDFFARDPDSSLPPAWWY
jgi:hypothetical protein